jgi:hypothetical protein
MLRFVAVPRIQQQQKSRGEKCNKNYNTFVVMLRFVAVSLLTQTIVTKLSKSMGLGSGIRDLVSGKYLFRIPDSGVKKALDPNLQHCRVLVPGYYQKSEVQDI